MKTETSLLFGPIAAAIFFFGVFGLSLLIPGYSHLHQTISVIGKLGTPLRIPFAAVFIAYALSLLIFASGIFRVAKGAGTSGLAAYFVALLALTQIGIAIFATPHPLHNLFGIVSVVGFLAPLVLALSCRGSRSAQPVILISYVVGFMILAGIVVNLSELFPDSSVWRLVRPYPGLVQRLPAAMWLVWCVATGILLRRRRAMA